MARATGAAVNEQQYAMLVIMLAQAGQFPGAFAQLDADMLENTEFLLAMAYGAALQEQARRREAE